MWKVAIMMAVLLVITLTCAKSDSFSQDFMTERVLRKLPAVGLNAEIDRLRCCDYFFFGPPGPRIGFMMEQQKGDPENMAFHGAFLPENIETVIDNSLSVPRVKIVMLKGHLQKIMIKISFSDYEKCRCLPKPSDHNKIASPGNIMIGKIISE